MRAINRATILDTIRKAGLIPRRDIALVTGLSQALVTGLTADLIEEGLIIEKKTGPSKAGRRPILLALNPDGAYVVGVNLAIAEINVVIVNFQAQVLASHTLPLEPTHYAVEEIADLIARAVQTCIWEANFTKDRIAGVGLGIPGLVEKESGLIRFLPNYGWSQADLKGLVEAKLNHPVYIDNSSNTVAIAAHWFGQGKGLDDFLMVTIENGVGLGGVINGRLYRGSHGIAGEFGHLTVDPQGPLCRCGKRGCVEAYVGNIAILGEARRAAREGHWNPPDQDRISHDQVLQAARDGSPQLLAIFARAGRMLALGLSYLINLYNPAKIIIAGNGVKAGKMLFGPMEEALPGYLSPNFDTEPVEIVVQRWTDVDWARGAGALVLQELYKSPVGTVAPGSA
jgi:predicted NBD/HSP70 family sugar kinase